MREPVLTPGGEVYDRETIEDWLETHATCPVTGRPLRAEVRLVRPASQLYKADPNLFWFILLDVCVVSLRRSQDLVTDAALQAEIAEYRMRQAVSRGGVRLHL
jgi:hypothetical protein